MLLCSNELYVGPKDTDVEGMQMRAWMVGIAVVVAMTGPIWSAAVMSNLVPVEGTPKLALGPPVGFDEQMFGAKKEVPGKRHCDYGAAPATCIASVLQQLPKAYAPWSIHTQRGSNYED